MTYRRSRRRTRFVAWVSLGALVGVAAATGLIVLRSDRELHEADAGRLAEREWPRPDDVPLPLIRDVADEWGMAGTANGQLDDTLAGGASAGDLDGDGDPDLAVAHGTLRVFLWDQGRFGEAVTLVEDHAVAVVIRDVDLDGWSDILVARRDAADLVIWGGTWTQNGSAPQKTALGDTSDSGGLLAGELSGDEQLDVVQLGRSPDDPDILWVAHQTNRRRFVPLELPTGGSSLAAEIVDVDLDGLLDIWITRDVGWDLGPDSVLSRRGDATGPWSDIAADLGAALEIDGMGITVADLGGGPELDAYVSDLGDNELLIRDGSAFRPVDESGAARIRPPGALESVVSSSWASGVADVNLDGRIDLVVANGGFPGATIRNKIAGSSIQEADPPAVLLGVGDGRFVDVWTQLGIDWRSASRGLAIADFDSDGDDDFAVVATDGSVRLLRNDTAGPSVTIRPAVGCSTVGAIVTVQSEHATVRRLLAPHTYAGAHQAGAVVGVPAGATVDVVWATGETSSEVLGASADRRSIVVDCGERS